MDAKQKGKARWLISCDESGVHGARYYGFGSLWMGWQRRGDFAREIREIRERHRYEEEFKWKKAKSRIYHDFYIDLVQHFFRRPYLSFHCIVVKKSMVDKRFHSGDYDLARRKHFTMLLTTKIGALLKAQSHREHTFRIWVDPIASRYQKADEAVEVISNNVLAQALGRLRPVDKVVTRDSKETDSIQLCDLLLGAVMDAWQQDASSPTKLKVRNAVAQHLGWHDLRADTVPLERKFNIWYFYDKTRGPREPPTRDIKLVYQLPARRTQ